MRKEGKTEYEKYIRTEELLSLQKNEHDMSCTDELTFQIIRQIAELHFKLIVQYLELAKAYMEAENIPFATNQLRRVDLHLKHLPEVFNLISVIEPNDYHKIHTTTNLINDRDSPGFNAVQRLGKTLWKPFKNLLDEQKITILDLLRHGEINDDLFQLMQEIIAFDESFQTLCFQHNKLVRRMNGLESQRFKDVSVPALENSIRYELFPELWSGISVLTESTFPGYYYESFGEHD